MGRRVSISSLHQPSAPVIDRVLRDIGGKNAAVLTMGRRRWRTEAGDAVRWILSDP